MKVEFKDTPFGKSLCVRTSEYLKLKKENLFCKQEIDSLYCALRAFCSLMGTDLLLNKKIFEKILLATYKSSKKRGIISFVITKTEYYCQAITKLNIYLYPNKGETIQIFYE